MTQSTLSHAIQTLERKLRVQLFTILGRDLQLTSAGQKILPHARKVLRELDKIRLHAAVSGRAGAAWIPRYKRAA